MRVAFVMLMALGLSACAIAYGDPAQEFVNPAVARAYIPLEGRSFVMLESHGAAFAIAPGMAVTNAHNADFLGPVPVIGQSRDYDLLFFRVENSASPAFGEATVGESVVAYGQGPDKELRVAHGIVRALDQQVEPRCATCLVQRAFIFEGNAGPGFSGGPVVDATSGAIIGITFGYLDKSGHRLMYAYPMDRVRNELDAIQGRLPSIVN
jgi:S1-C subfamily serine protease